MCDPAHTPATPSILKFSVKEHGREGEHVMKTLLVPAAIALAVSISSVGAYACPENQSEGLFGWCYPDINPQSPQEVLIPYCWGSPQDCRSDAPHAPPPAPAPTPQASANQYYVVYRYFCRGVTDNTDQGSCDVTTR